jgi:hypothetical protein
MMVHIITSQYSQELGYDSHIENSDSLRRIEREMQMHQGGELGAYNASS